MSLPRGDAAQGEPGAEFSAKIFTEGAIAGIFVGGHAAACDKVFQAFVTRGLAAVEWVGRGGFRGVFRGVRKAEGG